MRTSVTPDPDTQALAADADQASEVVVIGGGPAGLMAAQVMAEAGVSVRVFDGMASVGRKFLLAGRGGLNLTHGEPLEAFISRYDEHSGQVSHWLRAFGPEAVVQWTHGLGIDTFVGSSGRVFPIDLKAAPLLRSWLSRLRRCGVRFSMRHRWQGWNEQGLLVFETPDGPRRVAAKVVILALGGGSWARLGSDGQWQRWLADAGVSLRPLVPSNCGFDVAGPAGQGWSEYFRSRHAGQPFKSVALTFTDSMGRSFRRQGEFVATDTGVEGSLIYAASRWLREELERSGSVMVTIDLLPDRTLEQVLAEVTHPRGSRSLASHLKGRLRLSGIKSALMHELLDKAVWSDAKALAGAIKSVPLRLSAPRPLDEAISSAGGVRLDEGVDVQLRLRVGLAADQAVFCAGEMLDWEAPTGGYLLTACLASGRWAGLHALQQWQTLHATKNG